MRFFAVGLLLTFLIVTAGAGQDDPVKDDLAKLEGKWKVVSYEEDGVKLSADELKDFPTLTNQGKQYSWSDGEGAGKFTIDPMKKPKQINYTITAGDQKGEFRPAIYEISGDTWRECIAAAGKPRPRKFAAPEGSDYSLIEYQRVK
jgi:uncharacterized protein (TIGR03067 family)